MKTWTYIFSLFVFFSCAEEKEEYTLVIEKELITLPVEVKDSLQGGEIIMRKGGGFMSSQIVKTLKEPVEFSHCGFVVQTDTGLAIIHSLGREYGTRDGVQPSSFESFAYDAIDSSLCIVKPKVNDSLLLRIQEVAFEYYDQKYTFDYSFDLSTKDRLHCTEFIHNVLEESLQREIFPIEHTPTGVECLYFKNFFNPAYFETVYSMQELPSITFDSTSSTL